MGRHIYRQQKVAESVKKNIIPIVFPPHQVCCFIQRRHPQLSYCCCQIFAMLITLVKTMKVLQCAKWPNGFGISADPSCTQQVRKLL